MTAVQLTKPAARNGRPAWNPSDEFSRVRTWFRILVLAAMVIWFVLIGWIFVYAPVTKAPVSTLPVGANLTIVLAPVLAAAAAVERTLETIFNVVEGSWRTMIAYLGNGLNWLKSAETEVQQARQFLADVSAKYNEEVQSIDLTNVPASEAADKISTKMGVAKGMLTLAQQRLADAESNLSSVTSSDNYVAAKAAGSIVIGLVLGLIVATVVQLQMFALLGINVLQPRIDVFITGLVIGSGAYPVHSLVGILQQGKDALDSVSGYFGRAAPSAQATQQRITTVQSSDTPGEAPRVAEAVVETTTAKSTDPSGH
jgi:exonuclease VII small subunit